MHRRHLATIQILLLAAAACNGEENGSVPRVEIDALVTVAALIGGDPVVTGRVWSCDGTPPVFAYADEIEVAYAPAVTLATGPTHDDAELAGSAVFHVVIESDRLAPSLFGLPATFDLELEVKCGGLWVRSPPFPMIYLHAQASLTPPHALGRFWPGDQGGDLLVCEDTALALYDGGVARTASLELGFPCGAADLWPGAGGRRYVAGVRLGIAALDPGPVLTWSRPMLVDDWWIDVDGNLVVIREQGGESVLVLLDQTTGEDRVGPVPVPGSVPYRPVGATWPFGAIAADASGDILFLEPMRVDQPPSLTYVAHRLTPTLMPLDTVEVAHYAWQIPSSEATFIYGEDASHLYVSAAPDHGVRWIDRVDLATGLVDWSTRPEDGWRYPLGDAFERTVVASEVDFVWLDPMTGEALSARFAPDSGNRFLRAHIEPDGSIVMLADPIGGIAQGLYLFAPDGASTLRFHPGAAIMRWVAPGWAEQVPGGGAGALVSYFTEIHWLFSRADYEALAAP